LEQHLREIEISITSCAKCLQIEKTIEHAVAESGLRITLRTSLRKYPGCIHWHVKNGRMAGTLEITLWPQKHRAWFAIQEGRKAEWIQPMLPILAKNIKRMSRG
jgi:hypothetical protein